MTPRLDRYGYPVRRGRLGRLLRRVTGRLGEWLSLLKWRLLNRWSNRDGRDSAPGGAATTPRLDREGFPARRGGLGRLLRPVTHVLGEWLYLLKWRLLNWWSNRNGRYLVQGLPALLAVSGAVYLAVRIAWASPDGMAVRYRMKATSSFQAGDLQTAQLCYERLALLPDHGPEDRFGLALTSAALGQRQHAEAVLKELAPADGQGYPPAHLLQARRLLAGGSPAALRAAETHLIRALQGDANRAEAHAVLGLLYLRTGRLKEAGTHLVKAAPERPETRLPLARLYLRQGNKNEARHHAEEAAQAYRQAAEANLNDHAARLHWAEAALFLEQFDSAVDALRRGLAVREAPEYHRALAQVYVTWADVLERSGKGTLEDRVALLEQALQHDASNEALLQRLFALGRLKGAAGERARAAMQKLLAGGKLAAPLHFALGVDAWERGKPDEARVHWEQAVLSSPQATVAANNLAWLLAHASPADPARALALIDTALRRSPRDPRFLGTRGHVLCKLGRWKEALADLQASLKVYPDNRDTHLAMAEAYSHLGVPDMAAEHRRLANRAGGSGPVTPQKGKDKEKGKQGG